MQNKKLSTPKKYYWTVLAVVLLVGGAFLLIKTLGNNNSPSFGPDGINYGPATSTEKKETEQHKKDLQKQIDTEKSAQDNPSTTKQEHDPVLVDSSQYGNVIEVSAYVPGVIEDGGICTLKLTRDSKSITRTVTGEKDATTTRCPIFSVPRSDFPSTGTWTVIVSYDSSTSQGASRTNKLEVK